MINITAIIAPINPPMNEKTEEIFCTYLSYTNDLACFAIVKVR